jgi:DeoR/GlpR family transcriptional regulator of sugar metabolism
MNQEERQKAVLNYLWQKKAASYTEIEDMFDVSNMTIRRDIVSLAAAGKVIKTIGGAQIVGEPADMFESEILSRLSINSLEKGAITQQVLKYIESQDVVYIDGGSTCLELAKRIVEAEISLTVVTNSLLVYMELARSKSVTVICLGGQHDPISYCLTGPVTEAQAEQYFVNKAFISTKGFLPEEGTYESSVATYRIKQIMVSKSSEVVLLVDHTKFGQKSLYKVLEISQIDTVFIDSVVSQTDKALLESKVKKVIVCKLDNEQSVAS